MDALFSLNDSELADFLDLDKPPGTAQAPPSTAEGEWDFLDPTDSPQDTARRPAKAKVRPQTRESESDGLVTVGHALRSSFHKASWHPQMVLDLALRLDPEEVILERYDVSPEEYEVLKTLPEFRKALAGTVSELRTKGTSFHIKAAIQAEAYLADIHRLVLDPDTPASVQLDAIKSVVRWGKLEPKEEKSSDLSAAQFNISINF